MSAAHTSSHARGAASSVSRYDRDGSRTHDLRIKSPLLPAPIPSYTGRNRHSTAPIGPVKHPEAAPKLTYFLTHHVSAPLLAGVPHRHAQLLGSVDGAPLLGPLQQGVA